jgi:1,4-dihydroxy-2-naphthoyl-CoA synthase
LKEGKLYDPVLFERTGGVAKIALNRPKKLSAFEVFMPADYEPL